jgi:two-component system, OmpR family, sensor histidine kinase KdpD
MNLKGKRLVVLQLVLIAGILSFASLIGYVFRGNGFPETNIVLIYLLAVHITAWVTDGFFGGICTCVIATFLFNYFFTEPYLTFSVYDPSYIITFVIMTITALITSTITSHEKRSAKFAREKEAQTKALFHLIKHLTDAKDREDIASVAVSNISECFACQTACLYFSENMEMQDIYVLQKRNKEQVHLNIEDVKALKEKIKHSKMMDHVEGLEFYDWPIYGHENVLGVIRIPSKKAQRFTITQTNLLHSMVDNVGMAMDRLRALDQQMKSHEEIVQERYRGDLLRAISHDLRTPLTGIMGTSEMLMDMSESDDPRHSLAFAIYQDANWLHSLVENILSLTRLQEGKLTITKQLEPFEEVLGGAVEYFTKHYPGHEVEVSVPNEVLMVPMDIRLIRQVLINLLDNAAKHTLEEGEISVLVSKEEKTKKAVIIVRDSGCGISKEDLPNIFETFYTSSTRIADAKHGIGLGLTICDAIIKAHGGTIKARNRIDKNGAEFIVTLPLEVKENESLP